MNKELWYRSSAQRWEEALPIGNGRIGAMVFGGGRVERMALNEETLWSGYPRQTDRVGAAAHYAQARDLALAGRLIEAQSLIDDKLLGAFTQSYLPLGDMTIAHTGDREARDLVRRLSLSDAIHETCYRLGEARFTREAFVSHPAQALLVRLSADRPGAINIDVSLSSALRGACRAEGGRLVLDVLAPSDVVPSYIDCDNPVTYLPEPERKGMRARAVLTATAIGGRIEARGETLSIRDADSVELRLVARTSFNGYDRQPFVDGRDEKALCEADLERLLGLTWRAALEAHVADHRRLFDRVDLALGDDRYDDLPTDARIRGQYDDDDGLCALLFHYGRYLLIASSRPGGEPANLQGIWNQDLRAIWSCNYTININTQMNYWAAEAVNLPELCEPLFRLIGDLCVTGQRTARAHYGVGGAVSHHNTDIWRLSNPVGERHAGFGGFAFWPMSLGWMLRHLMEHDRYSPDDVFLRDRALPLYRLVARFYLDVAVPDGEGALTIAPASSPENHFLYEGRRCGVAARSAMTTTIMREVLEDYLHILNRLRTTEPMSAEARSALDRLPPLKVGSRGQLMEWDAEYEEAEPHHRHISHLYALYPGESADAVIREAARQSLLLRGDDGTGWSLAWKTAAWAALGDGNHAHSLLRRQLRPVEAGTACNLEHGGSYISLLDAHPPFQIDGNFGICAAIARMLVTGQGSDIDILPALPDAWRHGHAAGLRAPGGVTLDFDFDDGRVTRLTVSRKRPAAIDVHVNGRTLHISEDEPPVRSWRFTGGDPAAIQNPGENTI